MGLSSFADLGLTQRGTSFYQIHMNLGISYSLTKIKSKFSPSFSIRAKGDSKVVEMIIRLYVDFFRPVFHCLLDSLQQHCKPNLGQ